MIKKIYTISRNFLFSLLFPRICIGCGTEGSWICPLCLKKIEVIKIPYCPNCRKPTANGNYCLDCKSKFSLDGAIVCAHFEEGVLREAVHQFKFNFLFDIGELLGKMAVAKLRSTESRIKNHESCGENFGMGFDLVVPVPLHKKRFVFRGFNQAEVLAKVICREIKTPISKGLKRKRYTTPQSELDREKRLKNLEDAFVWTVGNGRDRSLQGKRILLVDDISTTGTTLEECAKVLKNNGAESVWAIVLGRG